MPNVTEADARLRVQDARTGSLAGEVTDSYLFVLENELHDWLRAIREFQHDRHMATVRAHMAKET